MSARGFLKDRCPLNASALTFYSLLSIVPVLAMIFGFAKGFKFEEQLKAELMARFAGQEEVFSRIIGFSEALLNNTKGGIMAGIGIAVLLWTVIRLMSHIERSFNDIWDIRRTRHHHPGSLFSFIQRHGLRDHPDYPDYRTGQPGGGICARDFLSP